MEKIIQSKRDIAEMLRTIRSDIKQICKSHFSNGIVTAKSWETSANSVVSYHKSKIPMLRVAGVMKDPSEYDYGWSFNNNHYSNSTCALTDADK